MLSTATPSDSRANPTNRPALLKRLAPSHDRRVAASIRNGAFSILTASLTAASATELKSGVGVFGAQRKRVQVARGWVVAHESAHALLGGVELGECTLYTLENAAAVLDSITACAAARPDGWLRGVGWELTAFPGANPSKAALDRIAPDRPAFMEAADGHSAWANSRALELAGITRDTPDPPDGRVERDPRTGEPSGTLDQRAPCWLTACCMMERKP